MIKSHTVQPYWTSLSERKTQSDVLFSTRQMFDIGKQEIILNSKNSARRTALNIHYILTLILDVIYIILTGRPFEV